jgi:heat shock protein beta
MMKLIINSLYKNKDIFLRELISNASDALDKIRLMALTDEDALAATDELSIKIKVEKDANVIHITDTGIGMTQEHLKKNLGTIAKSGTSEFFEKMSVSGNEDGASDLIGQFGVGFYSAFLVADKVVVTSKNNDDDQYVWESDSLEFFIAKDPRGNTLPRGTTVSLYLKEEAGDYLQHQSVKELIQKYSQFINFPIYLWGSKQVEEEVPVEEEADEEVNADEDEEGKVEEESDEEKPKTQKVTKTVYDWELINSTKPIWQRKTAEIDAAEYEKFYEAIAKVKVF